MQKTDFNADKTVNGVSCESVNLISNYTYVLCESVLQTICLVHACDTGSCHFKDIFANVKVEQEMKQVRKKVWKHNTSHKMYYLNKFCYRHEKEKYFV